MKTQIQCIKNLKFIPAKFKNDIIIEFLVIELQIQ